MQPWQNGATVDSAERAADPKISNEAWVETVRLAEQRGLSVSTRPARDRRDQLLARQQNYALSRRSYGMPTGYERIQWRKPS